MKLKPYWKLVSNADYYVSMVGTREIVLAKVNRIDNKFAVRINNMDNRINVQLQPVYLDSLELAVKYVESRLSNNKKRWIDNVYCINVGGETIALARYCNYESHFIVYIGTSTLYTHFETEQEAREFIENELGDLKESK